MINQRRDGMGTQTSEGFIRYLNKNGLDMPVALWVNPRTAGELQKPERDKRTGDLVYVAPGGGRVLA